MIKHSAKYAIVAFSLLAILLSPSLLVTRADSLTTPTFSTATNLSADKNIAQYPMVASSGNNVYVVWTEGKAGIFFRSSSDYGLTWTPSLPSTAMKLSPAGGNPSYPVITANGSNVYVAWSQRAKGDAAPRIYFTYSINFGASFSKPVAINDAPTVASITPVITEWGNDVYVAWSANSLSYVASSTNNGLTWGVPSELGGYHEPQLAAWGSNVYFISDNTNSLSIAYAYSNDNGNTWHSSSIGAGGSEPWIAASGSNVYIAFELKSHSGTKVYGWISHDNGVTLGNELLFSSNIPSGFEPQIYASGTNVYLAIHQVGAKPQVWMEVSVDSGNSWNNNVSLSGIGSNGWATDISISGQNIFTIWGSQMGATTTWNAYIGYSGDGGNTWTSAPGVDISNNANGVAAPSTDIASSSISSYGTHGFAAWQSTQTGIDQIWFASS